MQGGHAALVVRNLQEVEVRVRGKSVVVRSYPAQKELTRKAVADRIILHNRHVGRFARMCGPYH